MNTTLRALTQHCGRRVTFWLPTALNKTDLQSGATIAHLHLLAPPSSKNKTIHILSPPSIKNLTETLTHLASDDTIRALFLHGTIAGADLKYMRDIDSPSTARDFIRSVDTLCTSIQDFPAPVVAICRGYCFGAGMEVAAAADLRIAVKGAVFGMPETKVGIPSVVQASLIPGLIGWGRARELLYFGEPIDADKSLAWGFVNDVVTEDALQRVVAEWSDRFEKTGVRAMRLQKRLMREWEEYGCGRAGIEASIDSFGAAYETDEPRRMMTDFFAARAKAKAIVEGAGGSDT